MKFHTILILFAVIGISIQAFSLSSDAGVSEASAQQKPLLGDIDLKSPTGEQVSLIPYIGRKIVVVAFWAAWCPICKAEAARLNKLNSDPRVKVVAVNGGEGIKQIQEFVTANNVRYDVVTDPKADVAKSFGVPGMPYCVIIGRTGVIAYRGVGLPENLDSLLQQ